MQIENYLLIDNKVGIWKKQNCPGEHQFDYIKQGCTEKNKLRRQQPNCQQNPAAKGCEKSCQGYCYVILILSISLMKELNK